MRLVVSLARQELEVRDGAGNVTARYPVSTAANGPGEETGSFCTPRGRHRVRARIGAGLPLNSVFRARRPSGEIYTPELGAAQPGRDWILTRILWLCGEERGFNRLGTCDTMARYIYIHGTPDEDFEQVPRSHGCIRMRNADLAALFEQVASGTPVDILSDTRLP